MTGKEISVLASAPVNVDYINSLLYKVQQQLTLEVNIHLARYTFNRLNHPIL